MLKTDYLNGEMLAQFAPRPGKRDLLPPLTPKSQVALMCRMLCSEGWNEDIAWGATNTGLDFTDWPGVA